MKPIVSILAAGAVSLFFSPFPILSSFLVIGFGLIFFVQETNWWRSVLCAGLCLFFLYFTAFGNNQYKALSSSYPSNYYSQLTGNLLHGKLYLPWNPDPKLLELKNPYDPEARGDAHFTWDISLYRGKYYMYWGVAPALTFVAPYLLVSSNFPLECTIALWFALAGAVFGYLLMLNLLEGIQKKPPSGFQRYFGALLILGSLPYGLLLTRSHIYEQAIFSGHAYAMASLYLFHLVSTKKEKFSRVRLGYALAGFCYGLALMSRPTYALLSPAFLFISYFSNSIRLKEQAKYFFMSLGPLIVLMLAYNYFRFESPFEFGFFYQLNQLNMSKWGFDWHDSVFATSAFLFQWPSYSAQFPYVHLLRFGENWIRYSHRNMNDEVIGLFCIAPFSVFLFWDRKKIAREFHSQILLVLMIIGFLLMGVCATAGINVRYEMEFLPMFVIPALAWGLSEWSRTRSFFKRTLLTATFFYVIQFGFFSSFAFEMKLFEAADPRLMEQMRDFFSDDELSYDAHLSIDDILRNGSCENQTPARHEWTQCP